MEVFDWLKEKVPHLSYVKKRMNDDILIICAEDLVIYYLNPTAAFFVNLVDGKTTIGEIEKKLLARYETTETELEQDLVDMIRDLQWKRILRLE